MEVKYVLALNEINTAFLFMAKNRILPYITMLQHTYL